MLCFFCVFIFFCRESKQKRIQSVPFLHFLFGIKLRLDFSQRDCTSLVCTGKFNFVTLFPDYAKWKHRAPQNVPIRAWFAIRSVVYAWQRNFSTTRGTHWPHFNNAKETFSSYLPANNICGMKTTMIRKHFTICLWCITTKRKQHACCCLFGPDFKVTEPCFQLNDVKQYLGRSTIFPQNKICGLKNHHD